MDIVIEMTNKFIEENFDDRVPHHKSLLGSVEELLDSIDSQQDQIKILNLLLDKTNFYFEEHQKACKNPGECEQPYHHGMTVYFLTQKLNRLGVHFDEDTFTQNEKQQSESKLDKILKDLSEIKLGQEIIYEDLIEEINRLRELYFLGKKNWHQLLVGKCVDMVAGGVVSETVSKQIIAEFSKSAIALIR